MNKALLSCLLLLTSPCLFAQDVIIMKDSTKIKARVENISETQIQFRKYGNTDLSTYYVDKKDALKINFENGDVKNFGGQEKASANYIADASNGQAQNQELLQYRGGSRFSLVNAQGEILKRKLKRREMKSLLSNNVALDFYRYNRAFRTCTVIAGSVTVAFLGAVWAINWQDIKNGYYENDGRMWAIVGVGLATELGCAILSGVYGRKTAKSYNSYLDNSDGRWSLNFGATRNGIGLVLSF